MQTFHVFDSVTIFWFRSIPPGLPVCQVFRPVIPAGSLEKICVSETISSTLQSVYLNLLYYFKTESTQKT